MNPLDQLADIRLPGEVSFWPLALGYWIVAALVVVLIALCVFAVLKRRQRFASRTRSLQALNSINTNDAHAPQQIHHILKTAIAHYAQQQSNLDILQTHGNKWQALLLKLYSGNKKEEVCAPLCALSQWQYDERVAISSPEDLKRAAQTWIENALPPKKGVFDV